MQASELSLNSVEIDEGNAILTRFPQLNLIQLLIRNPFSMIALFPLMDSIATNVEPSIQDSFGDATAFVLNHMNNCTLRSKMDQRLSSFSTLRAGWNNDPSAKPIHPDAICAVKSVLERLTDEELRGWSVFPDPMGAIMFDYDSPLMKMALSIGFDGYSAVKYGDGSYVSANYNDLDVSRLTRFFKTLSL